MPSALEHFSQIRASRLGSRAAGPSEVVGSVGGQDTGGEVKIHNLHVCAQLNGTTTALIQQDSMMYIVVQPHESEFEVTGTCHKDVPRHRVLHRPWHWFCPGLGPTSPVGGC